MRKKGEERLLAITELYKKKSLLHPLCLKKKQQLIKLGTILLLLGNTSNTAIM